MGNYYGPGASTYYNAGQDYLDERAEEAKKAERGLLTLQQLIGTGQNEDTTYVGKLPKGSKKDFPPKTSRMGAQLYFKPDAQVVDAMMRDVRDLSLEWNEEGASENWGRMYRNLTDNPIKEIGAAEEISQRALGVSVQQAEGSLQDLSASRGGARSPMEEAALSQRFGEQAATEQAQITTEAGGARAKVYGEASKFMEMFTREYAGNVVKFAQDWSESQPGIRMEYQNMLTNIAVAQSDLAGMMMQVEGKLELTALEKELFYEEDEGGFSGGGAAGGAVSGAMAGTMILPGWGTLIGAIGGALLGGFM